MNPPLLFATSLFCCLASSGMAQTSQQLELAKNAGVELRVTSEREAPPNTLVGIVIPHGWKPTMKAFNVCRELLDSMPERRVVVIKGPIKATVLERLTRIVDGFKEVELQRVPIVKLGVMCGSKSFAVTKIVKGMPIENSGIKIGDKIVNVDDTPIITIFDLKRALCEYAPGTQVKLTVRRGDTRIRLSAFPIDR